ELRPTTPAPAESLASDSGSELDWLSSVDITETPAGAPSSGGPQSAMSAQGKPYSEMPPELAAEIDNLDLEKKVGSSDIDSLLHLSSAESQAITRTDQQPSALVAPQQEIDLDFESNQLDSILGTPAEPPMNLDSDVAGQAADTASSSPTEEQARP